MWPHDTTNDWVPRCQSLELQQSGLRKYIPITLAETLSRLHHFKHATISFAINSELVIYP